MKTQTITLEIYFKLFKENENEKIFSKVFNNTDLCNNMSIGTARVFFF
jgi:hypothetical protein